REQHAAAAQSRQLHQRLDPPLSEAQGHLSAMGPKRLLLFAATTGYQIRVFAEAARRLGFDLSLATDRCHILEDPWGDRAIPVRFERIEESLEAFRGRQF